MNNTALTCWVISDGRRGIENQALGLAEAASNIAPLDIDRHIIKNGKTFAAASPRLQFGLKSKPRDYGLPRQLPDIAIGCGRQAIAPLLALKKASASIFTAYVQNPKIDPASFDVVFSPSHDRISGPNVELMIGSPNRVTNALITAQTKHFNEILKSLPTPRVAMLIGGPSKSRQLGNSNQQSHLLAAQKAIDQGYSLMITTSRRTPKSSITDYKKLASKHDNIWLYDGEGENPYYAFLGGADAILVTEESTNMLTEACATGKPVFRLSMSGSSGKFSSLYEDLSIRCSVAPFKGSFLNDSYAPLLETRRAAQQFWAHFEKRNAILN